LIQDTRLNTKQKLEWILRYKNGWSYLPYSYDDTPGLPRVTQFQLFILFTVFGRKFQRARAAQKRDDQRFIKGLKFLMEKKDPRLDEWRDSSGPRRLSSRLSRRIEDRSNESVNHGPLTVIFDNVDPKVIRMSKALTWDSRTNFSESYGPSVINLGHNVLDDDEVTGRRGDSSEGRSRDYSSPRKLGDFFNGSDEGPCNFTSTSTPGSHSPRRTRGTSKASLRYRTPKRNFEKGKDDGSLEILEDGKKRDDNS